MGNYPVSAGHRCPNSVSRGDPHSNSLARGFCDSLASAHGYGHSLACIHRCTPSYLQANQDARANENIQMGSDPTRLQGWAHHL